MSLENTFVTVILSKYILYTQNKKEIFTCAHHLFTYPIVGFLNHD